MAIPNDSPNKVVFEGNGVLAPFPTEFTFFDSSSVKAILVDSTGAEITLVEGVHYQVSGGNGEAGTVAYPKEGEPLSIGQKLILLREEPLLQGLNLPENGRPNPRGIEYALDKAVMRDQQLQEQLERTLKYDISTPVEDQLSPQEFMQSIAVSRDAANSARAGAETARAEAEAAQAAAETSKVGAETAQAAAEAAKNEAVAITLDGISTLRSEKPVLYGPASANEGTTIEIEITDHIEDGITHYDVNVLFGSAVVIGSKIRWSLGNLDIDQKFRAEVVRRRDNNEIYSETAIHEVLVKDVPVTVQDGATMAYANTTEVFPGATVDADGVHTPVFSASGTNVRQITSATMQAKITSGQKTVLDGTLETFLVVLEKIISGDLLITDQGNVLVHDVTLLTAALFDHTLDLFTQSASDYIISGTGIAKTAAANTVIYTDLIFDSDFEIAFTGMPNLYDSLAIAEEDSTGWTPSNRGIGSSFTDPTIAMFYAKSATSVECSVLGSAIETRATTVNTVKTFKRAGNIVSLLLGDSVVASGISSKKFRFSYGSYSSTSYISNLSIKTGQGCSCDINLPAAPTKVFKNPLQGEHLNVGAQSTVTSLDTIETVTAGEPLFINGIAGIAGTVTSVNDIYTTDISSFGLTEAPQYASRKVNPFALAAGTAYQTFTESDYNLIPAGCTAVPADGHLILTASKIELLDDPDLKKLAMSVKEPVETFIDAKIFIEERIA